MKKRTAWILVAGVAAIAVGVAFVGAMALMMRGRGGAVASRSYLYLDLQGEIPEQPSSELGTFLERRPPSLRALVDSLDRAASDSRVAAVVVRVSVLPDSGWATVQELRDAITRFRRSGKPAYAHLEMTGNKEYYLASACSKIYAVPTAILDITGLATEVTFLKGTLDKLGVDAQFEGVGRYKNAPNQFTERQFTEPHREQMEALTDALFAGYLAGIAKSRGKTEEQVKALIDEGPYDGRRALKAGLVDELLYADQIHERLQRGQRVTPGRYSRAARGFGLDSRPKLAVVYAVGEIVPGESQSSPFGGTFAGSDTVGQALREAAEEDDVRAIVLRVDSPGGSGTASDVIWREVQRARKKKPLVVSMGDLAASGGYYIAMGSDAIVAQPGTITGSIGVFGGKFSLRGLYDKVGLTKEIISRGENADIFTEYRPWTDDERVHIRTLMTEFYREFVTKAAEGRKKSYDEIHQVAQGRVWTGAEALDRGLVDKLGGMDVAIDIAKERAGIRKDQEVRLVVLPERKGLLETLLERQEEGVETRLVRRELGAVLRWARVLGDGRPTARLPFDVRIR
jgi:protease IV